MIRSVLLAELNMDTVNYKDFQKLDIRIGTVVKAEIPQWSHWVMKLTVEFGSSFAEATEGKSQRTVFAGLLHFYKPEELEGNQYPFIVNLEKKKIGPEGDFSEGMMIMAVASKIEMGLKPIKVEDEEVDEYPILFQLPQKVPNGTKVM